MIAPLFHLNPDPDASGGGAPPPASPPAPPATPSPPPTLTLPVAEYQRYQALERELAEIRAAQQRADADREQERLRAQAAKGDWEQALAKQREAYDQKLVEAQRRHDELQARVHAREKTAAIARGLVGVDWASPDAARQAGMLLERDFETTVDAAGEVVVREVGTGRAAHEVIAERLASPAYEHFRTSRSRGGVPTGVGGQAGPSGSPAPPAGYVQPQSPGEQAYAAYLAQEAALRAQGYAPIGLSFGPGFQPVAAPGMPAAPGPRIPQ